MMLRTDDSYQDRRRTIREMGSTVLYMNSCYCYSRYRSECSRNRTKSIRMRSKSRTHRHDIELFDGVERADITARSAACYVAVEICFAAIGTATITVAPAVKQTHAPLEQ